MSNPAGWYPQPDGRQRYWDGELWTERFSSDVPAETTIVLPELKKHAAAPKHAAPSPRHRFSAVELTGWGALAVSVLIGAAVAGLSGATVMLGGFALTVGVIALTRGRVGWARVSSRAAGGATLGASLILMTVGVLTAPTTGPASVTAVNPAPSSTSVAEPVDSATPAQDPFRILGADPGRKH